MPASVRLDSELDQLIEAAAQRTHQTRSAVIRAGVRAYCEEVLTEGQPSHYDVWGSEIGLANGTPPPGPSGSQELPGISRARESERLLRERFRAVRQRQMAGKVRSIASGVNHTTDVGTPG